MTVIAEALQAWQSQPGWGIKAELMPPEVLATRRAKVVRRLVFIGLAILLVLCAVGWGASVMHSRNVSAKLRAENGRTTQLQATRNSFDNVTRIKAAISSAQTQIASLMGNDAKIEQIMAGVGANVPQGMLFSQIAITMTDTGTAGAATSGGATGAILDANGVPEIGTVTVTAITPRLTDVSTYLDTLAKVPGVVKPYPGVESVDSKGTHFSLQFGLSNSLLTHNYDGTKAGTN